MPTPTPIRIKVVRKPVAAPCPADEDSMTVTSVPVIKVKAKKLEYKKNETSFLCPHCDFTCPLENQSTMHYHLKKHDNFLPHKCKECGMRFLQKSLLDFHMAARHTADTQKIQCPCADCNYADLRKGNVVIHFLRIHLKDLVSQIQKPAQEEGCVAHCAVCNASFKNTTGFLYHASNCITIQQNHSMFSAWNQVQTAGKVGA
jgi:hypothetical protein